MEKNQINTTYHKFLLKQKKDYCLRYISDSFTIYDTNILEIPKK